MLLLPLLLKMQTQLMTLLAAMLTESVGCYLPRLLLIKLLLLLLVLLRRQRHLLAALLLLLLPLLL